MDVFLEQERIRRKPENNDFCNCHNVPAFHFKKYLLDGGWDSENGKYLIKPDAYAIMAVVKKELYPSGTQSENPGAPSPGFSLG